MEKVEPIITIPDHTVFTGNVYEVLSFLANLSPYLLLGGLVVAGAIWLRRKS